MPGRVKVAQGLLNWYKAQVDEIPTKFGMKLSWHPEFRNMAELRESIKKYMEENSEDYQDVNLLLDDKLIQEFFEDLQKYKKENNKRK